MKIAGAQTAATKRPSHPPPLREDCWNEDETYTLIEAWGDRHIKLNRGNLRQQHWQAVADTVNSHHHHHHHHHHGTSKKSSRRRTDVQCKNRIDTLKKKYKSEKARIWNSGGTLTSRWPFYYRLDSLIGTSSSSSSSKKPYLGLPFPKWLPSPTVPVDARSKKEKRSVVDDSFLNKNYSAVAAEAAATVATDSESPRLSTDKRGRRRNEEEVGGFKELAQAIVKFGEIYERVEEAKQRQFIELEKQRMDFMKRLEFERMQFFVDTQVQLEKIKRSKRAAGNDNYLSLAIRENA